MPLESLESLVARVATHLMPVDVVSHRAVVETVLRDLVEYFQVDTAFLRYNDHEIHATVLVAEWPPRTSVPDPDPLGVVHFHEADPIFALTENMKEPSVSRPAQSGAEYADRIRAGSGVPEVSVVAVPLISGHVTTGTLGFIKAGDRIWDEDEIYTLTMIAAMLTQVQARIRAEQELRDAAYHDDLTGLASRRALLEYLEKRLQPGQPGPVAAVFLDMDRLKPLNDFLGHTAVDTFLCRTAQRMTRVCDPADMVARLGGDEFVIVFDGPMSLEEARERAEELRWVVGMSVQLGSQVVGRGASLGVAVGEPGRVGPVALLGRIDEAMMRAKSKGGNSVEAYTDDMRGASERRTIIELNLRTSIDDQHLTLEYQPEFDLRDGRILGVEALVRWNHPVLGTLQPSEFIEVAESTNLAGELGRWVLRTACAQLADWHRRIPGLELRMNVNISPAQLVGMGFVEMVESTLEEFGLGKSSLCLEITEYVVVSDLERSRATLRRLDRLGVCCAIDDFGTGYSSLAHLKSLPVHTLKIDKVFVLNLQRSQSDRVIVESIVGLASAFGLDVVAEGLESVAAARKLLGLGCYRAQGFLLSKPKPAAQLEDLLRRRQIELPWATATPDLL
ncbi:putative bifunctional diguanylate cyclase/phosphodiesterase [Rhodococcus chondri]|uniref:EAL domain-containing protein n=1 Tax=Rhodococcus chondri TaxID=3065941 RepID=A0ABU7JPB9_9NOCA|nr:EAL domain-containing protein [Rhodococcus sp. CC-R104]MEE2031877.1 EAL domain-containing protein [Rhodococcus sp. CC-R104]